MKTFLIISTLLFSFTLITARGNLNRCVTNHNAPPVSPYYWPPDSEVKVHLVRGMFTTAQTQMIFAAMNTWSNASSDANAGISFRFAGEVNRVVDCVGCLTVTRRHVNKSDRKRYAVFNPLQRRPDGLLISAWIDLDFATTHPAALQGYMTHELGHGMGLWDCISCKRGKTIMNGFSEINGTNGLLEPSACDLEVVRGVYQLQRRVSKNGRRR